MAPVDVFGAKPRSSSEPEPRSPAELTPENTPLLLFPAGRTSREYRGEMREFPWKRGFVRLARRSGRPVLPICVIARPSPLFRTIAKLRRALNIQTNLEMFLLVREVLRPRQSITLICEEPIPPSAWNTRLPDRAHAARIQHLLEQRYAENR